MSGSSTPLRSRHSDLRRRQPPTNLFSERDLFSPLPPNAKARGPPPPSLSPENFLKRVGDTPSTPLASRGMRRLAREVPDTPGTPSPRTAQRVELDCLGNGHGGQALLFKEHCAHGRKKARRDGAASKLEKRKAIDSDASAGTPALSKGPNRLSSSSSDPVSDLFSPTLTASPDLPTFVATPDFLDKVAVILAVDPAAVSSLASYVSNQGALVASIDSMFNSAATQLALRTANPSVIAVASSVESLFASAASVVASREAAATALPTSTATSNAAASSGAGSAFATSSTNPTSSQSSSAASSSSSRAAAATSHHNNLVKTVVPAVVVPVVVGLIVIIVLICCIRKRRKTADSKHARQMLTNSNTPNSFAATMPTISTPRAMSSPSSGTNYSASRHGGAPLMSQIPVGHRSNDSQSSFATSQSVGVAVGGGGYDQPKSRWGRRSLLDVMATAAGVLGTGSKNPRASSSSSFGGERERSVGAPSNGSRESLERGVGGYNSMGGYQPHAAGHGRSDSVQGGGQHVRSDSVQGYLPGMPRPVVSPPAATGLHYDQFGALTSPSMSQLPPAISSPQATYLGGTRKSGQSDWTSRAEGVGGANSDENDEDDDTSSYGGSSGEPTEVVRPPLETPGGESVYQDAQSGSHHPYDVRPAGATTSRVDTVTSGEEAFFTDQGSIATESDSGGTQTQDMYGLGSQEGTVMSPRSGSGENGESTEEESSGSGDDTPRVRSVAMHDGGSSSLGPRPLVRTGQGDMNVNEGSWW